MRMRNALLLMWFIPLAVLAKPEPLDRIVAVVNDGVITEHQLDDKLADIRRQMADAQQPEPPADILRQQVLEHTILNTIQLQLARQGGIRIDDGSLNDALVDIAAQNHMTLAQFADHVRNTGEDWASFREQVRDEITLSQLRQMEVARRVHVSDREIDQFLQSASGKKLFSYDLHLAHILIQIPDQASKDDIAKAEKTASDVVKQARAGADFSQLAARYSNAENALKGGDLGWRPASELPTLFTQSSESMKPGDVSEPLRAGNGFHIIKLLERRGNSGTHLVKQYQTRHLLIQSDALRTPAQAKALAEKLRGEVLAGKSFADLARQYSGDPGSASRGGELGWVTPGDMVPAFDQLMQKTPVGQLSPVFQTKFGYHFLEVEAVREADLSRAYQRDQAADALQRRYYDEQLQLWLRKIRAEAYVDIRQ